MLVVRGTKNLRDRLKAPAAGPDDASTTLLGDWFATALFWRPNVALLVNQRTLLPVFVPLAPSASLPERAPLAICTILRRHGADETFIAAELEAMSEVRIAPTNDRSTVGVMNEFAFHGKLRWQLDGLDLDELSLELADMPLGPLHARSGSADRELAAVLGFDQPNVVAFRTRSSAQQPLPAAPGPKASLHQLKVTIQGTRPPVWRRVLVDGSTSLHDLHEVIQAAFGWWNYHLYEFEIGRARYGIPDPDWDFGPPVRDASQARLDEAVGSATSFRYTYDFGDNWEHLIEIEKIVVPTPGQQVPACTGGRRACPPEDCGGPWGYERLLEVLADPSHPEHREVAEWTAGQGGGRFDPQAFDPHRFTANLRSLRLARFTD